MFKVGDKAKGFKFDDGTDGVGYDTEMDDYVEEIGVVVDVYTDSFVMQFPDSLKWMYPASLAHLAKVGEEVPFEKGDRVKFTESSLASGMIDAKEGDVFTVEESYKRAVTLKELQGCYHVTHFEHVEEEVMDNTEEQEIKWEVGQEVWCLIHGKGVVDNISLEDKQYPIEVDFGYDSSDYTVDGKYYSNCNRTLFFSEPIVTAELFPPKKPFVPKLKKGDVILAKDYREFRVIRVSREDEHFVYNEDGTGFGKSGWEFRTLGEEIIFN